VAALKRRVAILDAQAVTVELRRILSSVRDGHTGVNSIPPILRDRRYPFRAYGYSDGIFIQAISPEHASLAGARLIAIDGMPIGEAMKRAGAITDGTNDQAVRDFGVFHLSRPGALHALGIARGTESAEFLLEKDGHTTALSLKARPLGSPDGVWMGMGPSPGSGWIDARTAPTPEWLKEQGTPFTTTYLPGSRTLYVRCNVIADLERPLLTRFREAIDQARARPTDRFVLDLRMNGGGDNSLLAPVLRELIRASDIDQRGRLFVVIGRRTQSAAQDFTTLLEQHTHAVFVGEPTGESPNMYGDPLPLELPHSHIVLHVSSLYWQDAGPRDERVWTGPELAAELTALDYARGVDPALEAILRYRVEPALEDELHGLLNAGEATQAAERYRAFTEDPVHHLFDAERVLLPVTDALIDAKRFAEADALLRVHTASPRASWRAFVQWGAALDGTGHRADAAKAYAEAVRRHPTAWEAVDRLQSGG
jgi:hypothetical protein